MGRWVHRLSNRNLEAMKADCSLCGPVTVYRSGNSVRCATSKQASNNKRAGPNGYNRRRRYAAEVGHCQNCGFDAMHSCQLDVDHKNGDWKDDQDNWWVLCANCHRLKTFQPEIFELQFGVKQK